MRIYLPLTMTGLAEAVRTGAITASTGYAVTPALREWYAGGDDEELEYAALSQAARASLGLLAAAGDQVPRRVVAACEVSSVPPPGAAAELGDATVSPAGPVPWSAVAAVHVDAPEAEGVVAEAVTVWAAAQNGDDDASFAVDACDGEELLWYATQEVPDLLAAFTMGTGDRGTSTGTAGRDQRS
jgi:hypothetical protein